MLESQKIYRTTLPPLSRHSIQKVLILLATILSLLLGIGTAQCAQVVLAWDPNTEPDLAGYRLYFGNQSRTYQPPIEVGMQTSYAFSAIEAGKTYYFAVTAFDTFGNESDYSLEVMCTSISSSAGANGTISPSGQVVLAGGESQTYTISPGPNYRISDVLIDGASVGALSSYTFSNVTSSHTISATFTLNQTSSCTITASSGPNGSISPAGSTTVSGGSNQTYTITPSQNYRVVDVLIDAVSKGALTTYTFSNVTANHTISASFAPITYTLTASAQAGGSISPSGTTTVSGGASKNFTITPAQNNRISDVLIDGVSKGALTTYTFSNVTANHTISARFIENQAPAADAGPDQTVRRGSVVTLNGSNSTDPDDSIASYVWTQTSGTTVKLSNMNAVSPSFQAPVTSRSVALTFSLTVTDKGGHQSTDSCIVNVSNWNRPPTASAGTDIQATVGTTVTLDGSKSTDPDGRIASFAWKQTKGTIVRLWNSGTARPSFTAPTSASQGEALEFELTVTDDRGLMASDKCLVNVSWGSIPPDADTGGDQSVVVGKMVTLNASTSSDPDDGIASYRWTQVSGPPVTLSDPMSVQPTFVAPSPKGEIAALGFQLTVTDYGNLSKSSACNVYIYDALPDLVGDWTKFTYSKSKISGTFRLRNASAEDAGKFVAKFYLSKDGKELTRLLNKYTLPSLKAARFTSIKWMYSPKSDLSGKYIIVVIDPADRVTETDESNNRRSRQIFGNN